MKRYLQCSLCFFLALLLAAVSVTGLAEEKQEIVYVLADALGQPRQVILSEGTAGSPAAETAEQAETGVQLPVSVSFQYELDGETVTPEELAGKSGHLVIRISYASMMTGQGKVKDEAVDMPIPFLAATVFPLSDAVFSNVEVTNGRIMKAGRLSAAVCVGLPGLNEALNLAGYQDISFNFTIPSEAVISADVTNFTSENAYTVVTGIPENTADISSLFNIRVKGFNVAPGIAKMMLTSGASSMLTGVNDLAAGAGNLSTGAGQLNTGAAALSQGLTELDGSSAALTDGAQQMIAAILESVNEKLQAYAQPFSAAGITLNAVTLDNYSEEISRLESELLAAAEAGLHAEADTAPADQTTGAEQAEASSSGTSQAADANAVNDEVYQALEALRGRLDGVKAFRDGLAGYTVAVGKAAQGAADVASGAGELSTGATKLSAGAAALNESVQILKGYYDGDIREMLDRVNAVMNLNYSGYLTDSAGTTLFVIRTDEI